MNSNMLRADLRRLGSRRKGQFGRRNTDYPNVPYYAIRHKPTGHYLPEHGSRKGIGGYTHDEPLPIIERPPRLFLTAKAARCALWWWLRGETAVHHSKSYEGDYDEWVETYPKVGRKAEDMEIVQVMGFVFGVVVG